MPTITVPKAELYRRLEREYTTEEFDHVCFEFGIELDDDVSHGHRNGHNGLNRDAAWRAKQEQD